MKADRYSYLEFISNILRKTAFETILNANGGHIGASSSSAELLTCLYLGNILKFDPSNSQSSGRDIVLARGHVAPLRYSLFSMLGWIDRRELNDFLKLGSPLQGHETMGLVPGVDITPSGSLGMLLSYGVGSAYAFRNQNRNSRVFVFLGDGEEQEGNVSEAARHATSLKLSNIVCIIDRNKKQLSCATSNTDNATNLEKLWEGYGWSVVTIENGHSIAEIMNIFESIDTFDKPLLIIADTIKGNQIEDAKQHISGYHTFKTCGTKKVSEAIEAIQRDVDSTGYDESKVLKFLLREITPVDPAKAQCPKNIKLIEPIEFTNNPEDDLTKYLKQLIANAKKASRNVYVLTADWTTEDIVNACGFRQQGVEFINVGIREQHMFSMAYGISVTDKNSIIIIICGDCFILRSADQLNAACQGASSMLIIGTDSGITSTTNGMTHQSSGQPAALIYMPGLRFFEPADGEDTMHCINDFIEDPSSPFYVRLHSGTCDHIDSRNKNSTSYIAYEPRIVDAIIVSSGITVGECIKAAKWLEKNGLGVRVINVINLQNVGNDFHEMFIKDKPVFIIYNGNVKILVSIVAEALLNGKIFPAKIYSRGFEFGTTGRINELLEYFKIDAANITNYITQNTQTITLKPI